MDISVKLSKLKLRNPTMLASGILGISGSLLLRAANEGAGAVVTKSIGPEPREGYKNPCLVEVIENSYLNAMGLPNPGVNSFAKEVRIAKEGGVPVVVSVFGADPPQFAYVASEMEKAGADAVELNVSCPHAEVASIGQSCELVRETVREVRKAVRIPIFVKLNPNVTDIVEIAKEAERAGADVITAINTVRAMMIDINTCKPVLSNRIGGLSGEALRPIAVRCVYEIYEHVKIPIVAAGGVFHWSHAVEHILAGAKAVQIGSGLISGYQVFREIAAGIKKYLEERGYRSVQEIVGIAHGEG
nr:dihydroorotate dehydrogenase [Candidatus Sigynarchaeota archaeon]